MRNSAKQVSALFLPALLLSVLLLVMCALRLPAQCTPAGATAMFSFRTRSGKEVVLAKGAGDSYLVYRICKAGNTELEYPGAKTKASFGQFAYSFYMRGGGLSNEGMDLNYVTFTNDHYKYVVYETWHARGSVRRVGVKVLDLRKGIATDIPGIPASRKGTLIDFRDNGLLRVEDELYE